MKIVRVFILSGLPLSALACSAAPPIDEPSPTGESVGKTEQSLDQVCFNNCLNACNCDPADRLCNRRCSLGCFVQCSGFCFPNCANQACGASDGCGGICTTGTCPAGSACGVGGTAGVCGALPNLVPSVTAVLQPVGFSYEGAWTIRVRNLGGGVAINAPVLMSTTLPAALLTSTLPPGWSCFVPNGYGSRFALECIGNVQPFNEVVISLTTSLTRGTTNPFSAIADPDNVIQEVSEIDNTGTATLVVP